MGVRVVIPTPLRRFTGGVERLEIEGSTVGECLKRLDNRFPGIYAQIVDESGELRRFVILFLNGEDVRFLKGLETPTREGDELRIVPAVAGGNR